MVRLSGKFPRYIYISDESFQLTLVCENGDATFKLYVDIIPGKSTYIIYHACFELTKLNKQAAFETGTWEKILLSGEMIFYVCIGAPNE